MGNWVLICECKSLCSIQVLESHGFENLKVRSEGGGGRGSKIQLTRSDLFSFIQVCGALL